MERKLNQLLIDFFNINKNEVKNASMESIRCWDSLSHIELIMTIEEEFNIPKILPDEIVFMVNFENIKKVIKDKGIDI